MEELPRRSRGQLPGLRRMAYWLRNSLVLGALWCAVSAAFADTVIGWENTNSGELNLTGQLNVSPDPS